MRGGGGYMSKIKVDKVDYWKDMLGIHIQAIKDGEPVGGIAIVQNELEMMIYIKDNFVLPE
ncbi:MAG TPA: hypothetical protein VK094_00245 [Pseudogracilibacillus sp.]|nr:hypothetical protein [Pseudogracilibacillus sp.]